MLSLMLTLWDLKITWNAYIQGVLEKNMLSLGEKQKIFHFSSILIKKE